MPTPDDELKMGQPAPDLPDVGADSSAIEPAAAQGAEVEYSGAEFQLTDDGGESATVHAETIQEPVHSDLVDEGAVHPHTAPVDALFDCTVIVA